MLRSVSVCLHYFIDENSEVGRDLSTLKREGVPRAADHKSTDLVCHTTPRYFQQHHRRGMAVHEQFTHSPRPSGPSFLWILPPCAELFMRCSLAWSLFQGEQCCWSMMEDPDCSRCSAHTSNPNVIEPVTTVERKCVFSTELKSSHFAIPS